MQSGKARFKRLSNTTKTRRYLDLQTGEEVSERAKEKILRGGGTKETRALVSRNILPTAKDLKLLYQKQHLKDYGKELDNKTLNNRMKGITKRLQSRNEETRTSAFLQLQTKEFRDDFYRKKRRGK